MSLKRFRATSLRDKQELKDEVADPRLEKLGDESKRASKSKSRSKSKAGRK